MNMLVAIASPISAVASSVGVDEVDVARAAGVDDVVAAARAPGTASSDCLTKAAVGVTRAR